MKKHYSWITPILLVLFSFILRMALISKGPYHIDCLNLAVKAEQTLDTGTLQNLFGTGYPLTVILGAVFIFLGRLFGIHDPVIMVNFMSVVTSSLAVGLLYLLCSKEYDSRTGIFASLLYSVTPIFLGISVYGKSHSPSIFFLLASIYILLHYQENKKSLFLFLSALCIGLMGACRLQDMVLIVPALTYWLFMHPYPIKQKIKNIFFFGTIAGFVVILFHIPYLLSKSNSAFNHQLSTFWGQGVTHSFRGLFSPALIIAFKYLLRTLTPIGLLLSFFGLFFLAIHAHKKFFFLLIWFAVPLLFYGNLYTIAPRYFAFSIIPLFIAQGYVLSQFFEYKLPFKLVCLVLFLVTGFMSLGEIAPPLLFRHKNALLPEYVRWVKNNTEENAIIIIGSDHGFFMEYYEDLTIMGKPKGTTVFTREELLTYKNRLDTLLNKNIPVYISESDIHTYDFHKQFANMISFFYNTEAVGGHYIEFWHKGEFQQIIYYDVLYRLHNKK